MAILGLVVPYTGRITPLDLVGLFVHVPHQKQNL